MRVPLPTNRLVALTLVGALLTGVVAVGLALPGFGSGADPVDQAPGETGGDVAAATAGAPTPNPNFTPAVSDASSGDHEHEHEEAGEYEEHEGGEHEEDE